MTTRRQHYVWRHYLEAWQDEERLVHWSRNGEILPPTNPKNVMVERDFYKLSRITKADVIFLQAYIQSMGSATLRKSHGNLVAKLAYIAEANEIIRSSASASNAEKRVAQAAVIEIEEQLQGQIEQNALPMLGELRQKRTDFLNNYEASMNFFRFIAHQYFRTKRSREAIGEVLSQDSPNHDLARHKNIVSHLGAENLGCSLFVDRNEFDIIFLEGSNDLGFITGDQPVVNLLGTGIGNPSETTELALYYPLSPFLACLLSPRDYKVRCTDIPNEIVEELNDFIVWDSNQFLVANSNKILQHVLGKSSSPEEPTCHIFDSL